MGQVDWNAAATSENGTSIEGEGMDAFKVHRELIKDYRSFTEGFVDVRDERIRASVERETARGAQWPDPWLSLDPAFASGGRGRQHIEERRRYPAAERIVTRTKGDG